MMLDSYHHSGSFCDILEAFKQTHQLKHLKSFFISSDRYLYKQVLLKVIVVVLSHHIPHFHQNICLRLQVYTDSNFRNQ